MALAVLATVVLLVTGANESELDIPAETIAAANEAGRDPVDVWGAQLTVDEPDARRLLRHTGELPWPVVPTARTTPLGVWDRLAACEASGRWNANTGNGYFGGIQADMTFWRRHGGLNYAPRPDLASRDAQIAVAQRGLAVQGWGAWPACSRRLGLR